MPKHDHHNPNCKPSPFTPAPFAPPGPHPCPPAPGPKPCVPPAVPIVPGTSQYIGARYVPVFADPIEWDKDTVYEGFTIVTYNGNSYTSKGPVPAGIDITNTAYWAKTSDYSYQIDQYRNEVANLSAQVTSTVEDVNNAVSDVNAAVDNANTASAEAAQAAASVEEFRATVTEYTGKVDDLTEQVQSLDSDVTSLTGRMDTAETELAQAQADIIVHGNDIAALKTTVAGHTTDIGTLHTGLSTLSTDVAAHNQLAETRYAALTEADAQQKADIAQNTQNIQDNAANIAENAAEIAAHEVRITALEGRADTTDTAIADIQSTDLAQNTLIAGLRADLTETQADVSQLADRVTQSEATVATAVEQAEAAAADVSAFDTRVTAVESDATALTTRVDVAETNIATLDARADNLDSTVATMHTTVANHQTAINGLTTRMDAAEVAIEALESSIDTATGDVAGVEADIAALRNVTAPGEDGFKVTDLVYSANLFPDSVTGAGGTLTATEGTAATAAESMQSIADSMSAVKDFLGDKDLAVTAYSASLESTYPSAHEQPVPTVTDAIEVMAAAMSIGASCMQNLSTTTDANISIVKNNVQDPPYSYAYTSYIDGTPTTRLVETSNYVKDALLSTANSVVAQANYLAESLAPIQSELNRNTSGSVAQTAVQANSSASTALSEIGSLASLTTTAQDSLVSAINEVNGKLTQPYTFRIPFSSLSWVASSATTICSAITLPIAIDTTVAPTADLLSEASPNYVAARVLNYVDGWSLIEATNIYPDAYTPAISFQNSINTSTITIRMRLYSQAHLTVGDYVFPFFSNASPIEDIIDPATMFIEVYFPENPSTT